MYGEFFEEAEQDGVRLRVGEADAATGER